MKKIEIKLFGLEIVNITANVFLDGIVAARGCREMFPVSTLVLLLCPMLENQFGHNATIKNVMRKRGEDFESIVELRNAPEQ